MQVEQRARRRSAPTRARLLGAGAASCSAVTRSSAGTSPSVCTTISARACASRSPKKRADVAARVGQPRGGEQRGAGVAGGDRVDRAEQQVGVGDAEHREHVLELRSSAPE